MGCHAIPKLERTLQPENHQNGHRLVTVLFALQLARGTFAGVRLQQGCVLRATGVWHRKATRQSWLIGLEKYLIV